MSVMVFGAFSVAILMKLAEESPGVNGLVLLVQGGKEDIVRWMKDRRRRESAVFK